MDVRKKRIRTKPHEMKAYAEIIRTLLKQGKRTGEIGVLLNKDHTTISYMVRKLGLQAPKYDHDGYKLRRKKEEEINQGKSYEEYLATEKDKRYNQLIRK